MIIEKRNNDAGLGLALVIFSGLLVVLGESIYLYRVGATLPEALIGVLPAIVVLLAVSGAYSMLGNMRHAGARRLMQMAVMLTSVAAAALTLVAALGLWQTGSIPRLQLLHGLTWTMIAPSVNEMARKQASSIALALVLVLLVLALLWVAIRHARRYKLRPFYVGFFAATCSCLVLAGLFASHVGAGKYLSLVATQVFRSDLDMQAALSEQAQAAETRFFRAYHQRLGETEGEPRYPAIYSQLRGSNVIWVVMESTRAMDMPLYGGSADMPNFLKAREHMILLKHLYSQDPRSTKAFAQLDMGKFSLLSWDSYSNNLTSMFPESGVASHLADLGYATASLVNSDAYLDHNKSFQEHHGYQKVMYRQALNPGSANADDTRLLDQAGRELDQMHKPFYMMVWPIETHHPYGREYWANQDGWLGNHPEGIKHLGASDHARYLHALHEADDWFGQLIEMLKRKGLYENTVIIVTGDHGEAFGEHEPGNVFHGNGVYQESVHVAGFIYSPKIDGLHVDDRNLRLMDIPATILNLSSSDSYLLNEGRSIFKNYKYEMPVYLFNSWAGAAGIIHDGYKLWHREQPGSPVYYATMAEIHQDPAKERQLAKEGQGGVLLGMLDDWEVAMRARTARLLTVEDSSQPPLSDVVRVYCDDGSGFRESLKGFAEVSGLSGSVTIPVNHACSALRLAPVESTKIPKGEVLDVALDDMRVVGDRETWSAGQMKLAGSSNVTVVDGFHFSITGDSSFLDYSLGSKPSNIKSVELKIKFVWRKVRPH